MHRFCPDHFDNFLAMLDISYFPVAGGHTKELVKALREIGMAAKAGIKGNFCDACIRLCPEPLSGYLQALFAQVAGSVSACKALQISGQMYPADAHFQGKAGNIKIRVLVMV